MSCGFLGVLLLALACGLGVSGAAAAQPFGGWLTFPGYPTHSYVAIPNNEALNPRNGFTFEAWVRITDPHGCSSIAGKN